MADRASDDAPPSNDFSIDPARFWSAGEDLDALEPPAEAESAPALKLAGPLPFARSGFPIMGFLATVYEQIASHAEGGSSTAE
jgi:hypothetical protein